MTQRIILATPEFVLAYPNLVMPKQLMPGATSKYTAVALFAPDTDLKDIGNAIRNEAFESLGVKTDFTNPLRHPKVESAFLNEDLEDFWMLNMSSTNKPLVKDLYENTLFLADQNTFYPGCICRAEIAPYSYDMRGHKGVSFQLLSITKVRDDKTLTETQIEMLSKPLE